jgi:hypothetical protein
MQSFSKWVGALAAILLVSGASVAADAITFGKIKTVNADKKEVILTDAAGKDFTFKLGDNVVINHGGKEGKTDLKEGEAVNILYDKGLVTWTANYILIQDGDYKACELMQGTVKSYDADKKQLAFTDEHAKEWTFATADAKVRLNKEDSKIADVKIGDKTVVIVDKVGDKTILKCVMVDRK